MIFITPDHALYASELELRFKVLREPLGHTREQVPFPFERESLHLVAHQGDEVVGCVLFHPEDANSGRLFQMAVASPGQGLGAKLVRALETSLRARGYGHIHMHARDTAVGFYRKLGYATHGDPFVEVGVLHYHMERFI